MAVAVGFLRMAAKTRLKSCTLVFLLFFVNVNKGMSYTRSQIRMLTTRSQGEPDLLPCQRQTFSANHLLYTLGVVPNVRSALAARQQADKRV